MALLPIQPGLPKGVHGRTGIGRVDVLTPELGDLDGIGEPFGLTLGAEAPPVGLPLIRCAVPNAVSLALLGLIRLHDCQRPHLREM